MLDGRGDFCNVLWLFSLYGLQQQINAHGFGKGCRLDDPPDTNVSIYLALEQALTAFSLTGLKKNLNALYYVILNLHLATMLLIANA